MSDTRSDTLTDAQLGPMASSTASAVSAASTAPVAPFASTMLIGLALAAAVALWWLGSVRIALDRSADASRSADAALLALWLLRGAVLALTGLRLGAMRGWRAGNAGALSVIAPAWPLVALAWSASTTSVARLALAEGLLIFAAVVLPLAGLGLRRLLRRAEFAEIAATVVGGALLAAIWWTRGAWNLPPT